MRMEDTVQCRCREVCATATTIVKQAWSLGIPVSAVLNKIREPTVVTSSSHRNHPCPIFHILAQNPDLNLEMVLPIDTSFNGKM